MTAIILSACSTGAENNRHTRSAIVLASGIAIPSSGITLAELRKEAISDALKNAAQQSCSTVDMNLQIKNMQIIQRQIRIQSTGKADLIRVIKAGLTTTPAMSYYSVQIEALTSNHPLTDEQINLNHQPPQSPTVALSVTSPENHILTQQAEDALRNELENANIQTADQMGTATISIQCTIEHIEEAGILIHWNLFKISGSSNPQSQDTSRTTGFYFIDSSENHVNKIRSIGTLLTAEIFRL